MKKYIEFIKEVIYFKDPYTETENLTEEYFLNNQWLIIDAVLCTNQPHKIFIRFEIDDRPFEILSAIKAGKISAAYNQVLYLYASTAKNRGTSFLSVDANKNEIWNKKIKQEIIDNVDRDNSLVTRMEFIPDVIKIKHPELFQAKDWGLI